MGPNHDPAASFLDKAHGELLNISASDSSTETCIPRSWSCPQCLHHKDCSPASSKANAPKSQGQHVHLPWHLPAEANKLNLWLSDPCKGQEKGHRHAGHLITRLIKTKAEFYQKLLWVHKLCMRDSLGGNEHLPATSNPPILCCLVAVQNWPWHQDCLAGHRCT